MTSVMCNRTTCKYHDNKAMLCKRQWVTVCFVVYRGRGHEYHVSECRSYDVSFTSFFAGSKRSDPLVKEQQTKGR